MCGKLKCVGLIGLWLLIVAVVALSPTTHVRAQATEYTITVTQSEGGTITPGTSIVPAGTNKKFKITPNAYYHITDVTVDSVSVYENLTWDSTNKKVAYYKFVAVSSDHEITATYALDTKKLTISKSGSGTGVVTDGWLQVNCGEDCVGEYQYDTKEATWPSVELTATEDEGSVFAGWFDAAGALLSKTSPYTTKMNKNKKIIAKFLKTYTLTTSTDGEGTGTVTTALVSGKNYGGGVYKAGSVVAVTAKPGFGSNFAGWSGDASGTSKKVNITMDADKTVNATFTPTSAAKIASKVSVVDPKSGVGSKKPGTQALRIGRLKGIEWPPPGSDYELDQTNVYVEELSAEVFETINEILCKIDQARYAEMLNQGDYKAQIDKNLCRSDRDDASTAGQQSQNQSSGANMPDYELWTLNSSRANDSSPHIVKAWIHQKGDGYEPDSLIYAKLEITEGASEENPLGLFTVNFKASPIDPMTGQVISSFTLFKGFLKTELDPVTNKVLLKFTDRFAIPEDVARQYGIEPVLFIEKATLDKRADATGKGTAYTYERGPWIPEGEAETFNFAFNQDYFRRKEVGVPDPLEVCLDRNNFAETVWSYGLYDSTTGARINRNSGFPIKKNEGAKNYYGWIGYWGTWFPEEVTLNNGDTVYKVSYGPGGTEEEFTVLKSGGRLKKHTRKELTLGDIKNIMLEYRDLSDQKNYRIVWDGTNFNKVEWLNEENNYTWEKIDPPVVFALANLSFDTLMFYSRALGGQVQIRLNYLGGCSVTVIDPPPPPPEPFMFFDCSDDASDSTPVVFYSESLVYPDDPIPANLVCFTNCPDPSKLGDSNPYNDYGSPQVDVLPAESQYATYTFDTETMTLSYEGIPVILEGTNPTYPWGIMSGPLFEATSTNLDLLACEMNPGDPNPDSTCGYRAWSELPEFYTWETGPNNWNHFVALVNPVDSSVLRFDPPLQVIYTHTWEDLTQSVFYLEYSGFGNLHGIPGICVDEDTGEETTCGEDSRWIPQFNIPEGTQVTDASDNVTQYYVKPLEIEQRMAEAADPANCEALTLKTYTLPDLAQWVDPNIGPEPVVEGPPAVIGGVLQ